MASDQITRAFAIDEALNDRAQKLVATLEQQAQSLRVHLSRIAEARVVDCGANAPGGLEAGLFLARVCTADLARVSITPDTLDDVSWPHVLVTTDHPVTACLLSQYAGWQLQADKFFAMGSGPMRALACKEPLFERLGYRERAAKGVGVLECRKAPSEAAIESVASACGIDATNLSLLYAPTGSLAGALQVVARSVETALHKLAELDFDLSRIVSAIGTAPLPPVSRDDLAMIGRTNDAILYGARVLLFVRGDDEHLSETGPRVPSCASSDHGAPFIEIFKRYNNDFYAVDPHLFSPAEVTFQNLDTGYVHRFGRIEPDILKRSFALEARR